MKIAVIGFGAASIGILERMADTEHELHVYEKSKDIYSSSISGIRADGKLFVSEEMGGDLAVPTTLQKQMVELYLQYADSKAIETGDSFLNSEYFDSFYKKGFQPVTAQFHHIGTDQLTQVLFNIYEKYRNTSNINIHFNSQITDITRKNNLIILNDSESFDCAFIAVGRSGHGLVRNIIGEYPQLIKDNTTVDLGVRLELPDHIVETINKEMYEFKIRYRSKTGYNVRTFCNNPSGYVVTESYDDFMTVNGHSQMNRKSNNTNFAVLTTVQLTQPFNDPVGYGSHIAKLTNILAGKNKVILQTYQHFKASKRTKKLYRVLPTLPEDEFILGDINLAFPRRIAESIIDFLENLNAVLPGVTNPDNLVYAPEIKFYSNKLKNETFDNLKFVGDCSGLTRSIIYATAHGWMEADSLLRGRAK